MKYRYLFDFLFRFFSVRRTGSTPVQPLATQKNQDEVDYFHSDNSDVDDVSDASSGYESLESNQLSAGLIQYLEMDRILSSKYENTNDIITLLKQIPLLSGLLRSFNQAGNYLNRLVQLEGNESELLQRLGVGFQFTGLALLIVDFLRIPAIYLAAMLLDKKPPITLSKNARWLYSAVLLGLTIAALAVPAAAPPIAFAMAGLALCFSLVTMTKTLYHRYQAPKKLKAVNEKIATEMDALNELHLQTIDLEEKLVSGLPESEYDDSTQVLFGAVTSAFDVRLARLEVLHATKLECEALLKKHDTTTVIDKGISVCFSAIALAGLTLSLFFPPVGLAILAGTALAGAVYLSCRIATPLINKLIASVSSKKSVLEVFAIPSDSTVVAARLLSRDYDALQSAPLKPSVPLNNEGFGGKPSTALVLTHGMFAREQVSVREQDLLTTDGCLL